MHGGEDDDTADYHSHPLTIDEETGELRGVYVFIDGVPLDGNPAIDGSPGDDVGLDIENVVGSPGDDILLGTDRRLDWPDVANRLYGGEGDDVLDGLFGADLLDGGPGTDTITYALRDRTPAPDNCIPPDCDPPSTPLAITLDGLADDGADFNHDGKSDPSTEEGDRDRSIENATGGALDDIITATRRDGVVNVLRGMGGDDTLNTRDGTLTNDVVDCGDGKDSFMIDGFDTQTDCEVPL
jgi:hypothetical protein